MRTDDIQPLSEHRAHLTAHFKQVQETGRPLFVTSNGRTAAVVLSPDAYDRLVEKAELVDNLALIDQGMQDVKAGRVREARAGIEALARKHGLMLPR
jgi:prevent-host-death family protein